jgi:uncharacterized protein DUF5995
VRIEEVVAQRLPGRMDGVIGRMREINAALPPGDGIAAFTVLYLAVTEAVAERAKSGTFEDVRFVRWLDVAFAKLYFEALRNILLGRGAIPKAWAPLVEARGRKDVVALQFALAGMNAHINRDLPIALVRTCHALEVELRSGSPQQRDYRRVNRLLVETEERVKGRFLTGLLGDLDVALGALDDVLAMWKVERAREAAWVNAQTLWALRELPQFRTRFIHTLDRMVGLAGRGLLRPVLDLA